MAVTVVDSRIVSETAQADGTVLVHEQHTLSDGRVINYTRNLTPDVDPNSVLALAAQRLQAQLDEAAAVSAAATVGPLPLSPAQFMARFTQAERIAIRDARKTDPILDDFFDLAQSATFGLDITSADVQQGVQYLVSKGLITSARATEILTP